ncbi:hypothetical protein ACFSMW_04800 [Virgibacillus halophilus]|uniref:Uncharacterized protein n=1 Tax=Tigheibacillus halophilus TaxID=361280 RepID=A0ABU5CB37_9BACI|nr:hypothetical protein [Virgibacillus halophilus]
MKQRNSESRERQFSSQEQTLLTDDRTSVQPEQDEIQIREMDVLNLPPRSEVHQHAETSFHLKLKRPLARFIIVVLLLVLLCVGGIYLQKTGIIDIISIFK